MSRRGIALLITIAFVTAITALIGVAGALLNRSFERVSHKAFLIQSNVLFDDFYGILKANSGDINGSAGLDIFLNLPLFFSNEASNITADITFESDASRVNINRILEDANATQPDFDPLRIPLRVPYEEYFDHILTVYNVSDKMLLLSMIADSVDSDTFERLTGSEIALQNPDFTQGHIYDMHHFKQILTAYKQQTQDFNVDDIPWERLISFRNDTIDFNHITPETLHFIDPSIPEESLAQYTTERVEVYDRFSDLPISEENVQALKAMDVAFYSPNVVGKMNVIDKHKKVAIAFAYDLSTQKVNSIAVSY